MNRDSVTESDRSTVTPAPLPAAYSPATHYADDYCATGSYPTQWTWNPAIVQPQDAPATLGTPRIEQVRNGVVIATYTSLGGDKGYSRPDSADGGDTSVGPFRRQPYLQWKPGDVFNIHPAVYSGRDMQIYLGPSAANATDYSAGVFSVPENITIRGISVNGVRPVIVNPATGASNDRRPRLTPNSQSMSDRAAHADKHRMHVDSAPAQPFAFDNLNPWP